MRRINIPAILGFIITLFFFLGIAALLSGCLPERDKSKDGAEIQESGVYIYTPADGSTAQTALDWDGTYRGTLPCADCPGILTELALEQDGHYSLILTYLDRSVAPLVYRGVFQWGADGNHIILPEPENLQFWISENRVIQLDRDGNKISGPLADLYILEKQDMQNSNTINDTANDATENSMIGERYWKLLSLRGQEIAAMANEPHIILHGTDKRVSGSGGCNRLMGQYMFEEDGSSAGEAQEMVESGTINFIGMASTRMACSEGMDVEDVFLDVLGSVNQYTLDGDTLILTQDGAEPLAQFEAVYLR